MTSTPPERVAIVGTGLIGTSIAMAAARVGSSIRGWDPDPDHARRAAERSGMEPAPTLDACVADADIVVVCAPVEVVPDLVVACLALAPEAIVTDAASIKGHVAAAVAGVSGSSRFVPGHPMGGSERSGPEHAAPSIVDGIVWVLTPTEGTAPAAVERLSAWIARIGARPVVMEPERHDRLVAFVSHLPQVASTTLMELAATEEADEPEILLLAAGGFRDLTRLAASNPGLWSAILLANRDAIVPALDLYTARLAELRTLISAGRAADLEALFDRAKRARLTLAAKPTVRAGVAVLQVQVPDRPGALAELTSAMAEGGVNIEDLQIVHSPEGGRGTVHLTVAAAEAGAAVDVLAGRSFDPIRLA
ncbi:MAG TPA: prephenate dehydrogenase/arogenate dehydrogenase family protein [Actinomycetota bacterium]|jgi:prephenate dehydrogenase